MARCPGDTPQGAGWINWRGMADRISPATGSAGRR